MENVVFEGLEKTNKVSLPSIPKSEFIILEDMSVKGMEEMSSSTSDIHRIIIAIKHLIKDWNLVDKEGKKLPINEDTIRKFSSKDFLVLSEIAGKVFEKTDKKKETILKK